MCFKKQKNKICACCGRRIGANERDFSFHMKDFYPDYDGIWQGYRKMWLCKDCMEKVRVLAKEG